MRHANLTWSSHARVVDVFLPQGKEGPKTPLSDVITILPPKEEMVLEVTPNFG